MAKQPIQKFEELKWRLVIEFDQAEVAHEWWAVETVNDHFDFSCAQCWGFWENLSLVVLVEEATAATSFLSSEVVVHFLFDFFEILKYKLQIWEFKKPYYLY